MFGDDVKKVKSCLIGFFSRHISTTSNSPVNIRRVQWGTSGVAVNLDQSSSLFVTALKSMRITICLLLTLHNLSLTLSPNSFCPVFGQQTLTIATSLCPKEPCTIINLPCWSIILQTHRSRLFVSSLRSFLHWNYLQLEKINTLINCTQETNVLEIMQ